MVMATMLVIRWPSPSAPGQRWPAITRSASGYSEPRRVLTKVEGLQHGGSFVFDKAVRVKLTLAFHGSVLPDGSNGGNPCGFVVTLPDGIKIYDAADTALFGDMALIGEEQLDLAILPIGDYYTMGPEDAVRAVKLLRPRFVLPIHYNTFPPIAQDATAWASRVKSERRLSPSSCNRVSGLIFPTAEMRMRKSAGRLFGHDGRQIDRTIRECRRSRGRSKARSPILTRDPGAVGTGRNARCSHFRATGCSLHAEVAGRLA